MFVTKPSWVHDADPVELSDVEGILVNVKDIAHVEFAKLPEVKT